MNFTISEFEKMKRCSMLLIGFIGVTFSPIISIIQNSMMTVQAGSVENYTFRELLNNTIWNFPDDSGTGGRAFYRPGICR